MSEADIIQANSLRECGVSSKKVMSVLAHQRGGYEHLGFTKKDFFNNQNRQRRATYQGCDAESALAYLRAKGAMNTSACYRYTTDDEGRLENLFWADAKCVVDYRFFNDVMSFDATYDTNYYKKPLVIFVGANNHKQTVLFGTALLVNETKESYIWLLNAFRECHDGRQPGTVITDGDNAMKFAITEAFPNAKHRLCHWHLNKNCTDNVKDSVFLGKYQALRDLECTAEVFDARWTTILGEHGVPASCRWAVDNYEKRKLWSYCYLVGQFCAGMKSTQRSEGINAFIKSFITPEMKIYEVLEMFDRELVAWRQKEYKEEYMANYTTPVLRTSLQSLEMHAWEVYTPAIFRNFVKTLVRDQMYFVVLITRSECGMHVTYNVQKYASKAKQRKVEYHKEKDLFECSCARFEEYGMVCVHMITVFKVEHIEKIPESCILKRWTKAAGSELLVPSPHPTSAMKDRNLRYAALSSICSHLCNAASDDTGVFAGVRDKLLTLCSDVGCSDTIGSAGNAECHNPTTPACEGAVLDPEFVRAKGCGQQGPDGKKAKKTPRLCSVCRLPGHKVTTCPTRRESAAAENESESSQPSQSQPQSSHATQPEPPAHPPYYHMQAPQHVQQAYYYPYMQPPVHPTYYHNTYVPHTWAPDAVNVPSTGNTNPKPPMYGSNSIRDALKYVG